MNDQLPGTQLFKRNRGKFTKQLPQDALAFFNSNDEFPRNGDQFFPFRQNSDLFYLTGIDQEETFLLLFPECPNRDLREVLFIRRSSEKTETWEGHKLTAKEASDISGIEKVRFTDELEVVLPEVMAFAQSVFLNSNEYPKYYSDVPYRDLRFAAELKKKFPNHDYRRSAPIMHRLRMIKEPEEIKLISKAIEITGKAYQRILKYVEPGKKEYEVEAEISYVFALNRANGHAYKPIIASGKNACVLHYVDNRDVCSDGELLLMDFGAEYMNYAADLTRTIPVNGKFTDWQRACYESVWKVQKEAIKMLVPGNTIDQLNKEVNSLMEAEMIRLGLFSKEDVDKQDKDKPLYMKYFMHGTSHPIGLDVHDVGSKYEPFRPGMVFTCEPGLYIREQNMGIRLENNIVVSGAGPIDLTKDIPIDPDEIEKLMK
jgi:Xaa-Pro aminopeptidase